MKLPILYLVCSVLLLAPVVALAAPGKGQAQGNGPPPSPPGQAGKDNPPPSPPPPPPAGPPAGPAGDPGAVMSPEGLVTLGTDQNLALDAVRSGQALPLDDLLPFVVRHWGGRVIDAKLLTSDHGLFYRLTVLTDSGLSRRVFLDARTGQPAAAP